jgi:signal transduction histidine kinase
VDELKLAVARGVDELARARDEIAGLHATTEAHLEQLRALDRLKSRFLSMASHELKTPLAVVSGYAQIARRRAERRLGLGQPSPEDWEREQRTLVDALRQVTDQTGRLGRLVDELLDVSRIESGRLEFRLAPLDLWRLAAELVPRMQTMTERHVLRLEPAPRDVIPEGLGLGLYISREIIVRHGGRIWATSGPGRGSTFYVALPTLAASAPTPTPASG